MYSSKSKVSSRFEYPPSKSCCVFAESLAIEENGTTEKGQSESQAVEESQILASSVRRGEWYEARRVK